MKHLFSLIIFFILFSDLAWAAGKKEIELSESVPETLKAAALVGPSGIGMAYLFSNPPESGGRTVVSFEADSSVELMLPKILKGDLDIGILPPNVAAKLYNLDPDSVVAGAIVGNGMIALITRDASIKTLADLAGKTVSVIGQGATPEYVIRTLLEKQGMKANSVTLDFSIPSTEIPAALISGKILYAFVPEPFSTVAMINGANGDSPVRRALLLRDEWKAGGFGADFPMTLCVINKEYAKRYPATVHKFLAAYKNAIAWTVANPGEAGIMAEKAGLGLKAPVAAMAIPTSNFVFVSAVDGRNSIETLLSVFLALAPDSIGGKLPDDGFYFK